MNAPARHSIDIGSHIREFCGQSAARYMDIAHAAHDLSATAFANGSLHYRIRRDRLEALRGFLNFVLAEESFPLVREQAKTDGQSALPEYPITVEALQE